MNWILSPEEIDSKDRHRVGGKGYALSLLVNGGFKIPRTVCITSDVYQEFVLRTGLRERILLELHRKDFKAMRWEEIWDCATRIRNMFLTKPIPDGLAQEIRNGIDDRFRDRTVAVRSSAPEEDDAQSSFAGLHESYINVAGEASILKHIRLVWSSLWSDAALLYRQEIGLDYEFIDLLTNTNMASLERNNMLMDLAGIIRSDQHLADKLKQGDDSDLDASFLSMIDEFIEKFGDLSCAVTGGKNCVLGTGPLYRLLLEMAAHPAQPGDRRKNDRINQLLSNYLNSFEDDQKMWAQELLELARSSYQLRDDDNIYLGRIEAQLLAAVQEAKRRLENKTGDQTPTVLKQVLEEVDFGTESRKSVPAAKTSGYKLQARQLIGQPAGPGISKGKARVVRSHSDLADFKHGEVLVCDAVDPNITFVVPLAAAVVERRGGMLIHGAIIAREYGLPCITGIPDATTLIQTGEEITVDGYLGIVTLSNADLS